MWVNRAVLTARPSLLVFLGKQTYQAAAGMSQTCQNGSGGAQPRQVDALDRK
jgi:hypothetical protein